MLNMEKLPIEKSPERMMRRIQEGSRYDKLILNFGCGWDGRWINDAAGGRTCNEEWETRGVLPRMRSTMERTEGGSKVAASSFSLRTIHK